MKHFGTAISKNAALEPIRFSLSSEGGRGCFVAELLKDELTNKRDDLVTIKMLKDIAYYKEIGLSLQEIIEAMEKLYNFDYE